MKFKVFNEMFVQFPELKVGIIVAKDIKNSKGNDKLLHLLDEVENLIKLEFTSEKEMSASKIKKHIAKHKLISPWKAVFSDLRIEAELQHTNVEQMISTVLKGDKIKSENTLVGISDI